MAKSQLPTKIKTDPKQKRSIATLQLLTDTTLELGKRHGLFGFTTNHIAAASNIDISSIYRFFDNLPSIWLYIAESWLNDIQTEYNTYGDCQANQAQSADNFFIGLCNNWLSESNIERSIIIAELWHSLAEFKILNTAQFEFHRRFCAHHLARLNVTKDTADINAFARYTYTVEDAIAEQLMTHAESSRTIEMYHTGLRAIIDSIRLKKTGQ